MSALVHSALRFPAALESSEDSENSANRDRHPPSTRAEHSSPRGSGRHKPPRRSRWTRRRCRPPKSAFPDCSSRRHALLGTEQPSPIQATCFGGPFTHDPTPPCSSAGIRSTGRASRSRRSPPSIARGAERSRSRKPSDARGVRGPTMGLVGRAAHAARRADLTARAGEMARPASVPRGALRTPRRQRRHVGRVDQEGARRARPPRASRRDDRGRRLGRRCARSRGRSLRGHDRREEAPVVVRGDSPRQEQRPDPPNGRGERAEAHARRAPGVRRAPSTRRGARASPSPRGPRNRDTPSRSWSPAPSARSRGPRSTRSAAARSRSRTDFGLRHNT